MAIDKQIKQRDCNYVGVWAPVSHLSLTENSTQNKCTVLFFFSDITPLSLNDKTEQDMGMPIPSTQRMYASPNLVDISDKLYITYQHLQIYFYYRKTSSRVNSEKATAHYTKLKARIF